MSRKKTRWTILPQIFFTNEKQESDCVLVFKTFLNGNGYFSRDYHSNDATILGSFHLLKIVPIDNDFVYEEISCKTERVNWNRMSGFSPVPPRIYDRARTAIWYSK